MGNKTSSHVQHTPLAPQLRFPRVVNARFTLERTSTLRLPLGFWSHTDAAALLEIVDEETGAVAFKVRAPTAGTTTAPLLLDKNGVPVAAMEAFPVGPDYAMYVPYAPQPARAASSGDAPPVWDQRRALCYLQTNTRPLEKRLLVELEDLVTRGPLNLRVESLWQNHEALFWLDRGLKRERECIARVYVDAPVRERLQQQRQRQRQQRRKSAETAAEVDEDPTSLYYCVGVAPGVDVAMIVLACAAMDLELAKKESGENVVIPDDEATRMLAQRHHGTGDRNKWRSTTLVTAT